jgi:hypothetical protein
MIKFIKLKRRRKRKEKVEHERIIYEDAEFFLMTLDGAVACGGRQKDLPAGKQQLQ